jgi:hypothetical protein
LGVIIPGAVTSGAPKKVSSGAEVTARFEGAYEIFQLDKKIGTEKFTKVVHDDNTVEFTSQSSLSFSGRDTFKEKTSLVLQEDSYFPRKYRSEKIARGFVQEITLEMIANVANIRTATTRDTSAEMRAFSTGSICLEGGLAYQFEQVVRRYDSSRGGKQRVLFFDPISKKEGSLTIEAVATVDTTLAGKKQSVTVYSITKNPGGAMKVYADKKNNVLRVVDDLQKMRFVLSYFSRLFP